MTQLEKPQRYWRSLNELEGNPQFEEMLHREFPQAASEFPKGLSRRRWIQLMGASLALGAAGCRFEEETIATFVKRPQNRIPGETQKYATTFEVAGQACPFVVTSYDGRPIKIDGNPEHPLSRGASSGFAQGQILEMYDPDRSRGVSYRESDRLTEKSWDECAQFLREKMSAVEGDSGEGVVILAEPTRSPTVHRLRGELKAKFPNLRWFNWSSIADDYAREGAVKAFEKPVIPCYQLENAKVIVSIDADPFHDHELAQRNSRGWAMGRDVDHGHCNRLYCVESQFSVTGMSADHRLPLRSDQIHGFLCSLVEELTTRMDAEDGGEITAAEGKERYLQALAQDLVTHRGQAVLIAGRGQSAKVHALVHAINGMISDENLAQDKQPVYYIDEPFAPEQSGADALREFVELADAGKIDTVVILGGNPVYNAPANSRLQAVLLPTKIPNRIQLSLYENETSLVSSWHINAAHALEGWGDVLLSDGSYGVTQPMIEPLFDGKSVIEVLQTMLGEEEPDAMGAVSKTAKTNYISPGDDRAWTELVYYGFKRNSQADPSTVQAEAADTAGANDEWKTKSAEANMQNGSLEVVLVPGSSTFDGRFANNGWLLECPDPITKVTWHNAAIIGPSTAKNLGVAQDDVVEVTVGDRSISLPVFIQPGQAQGSIGIALGYGRTKAGHVGGDIEEGIEPVGKDATPLRDIDQLYHRTGAKVEKTSSTYELATTQDHFAIDKLGLEEISNRMGELVREGTFESYTQFLADQAEHGGDESTEDHDDHDGDDHDSDDQDSDDHETEDHDNDDHGHGHHAQWPDHHLHFPNVDLNPGPAYTTENRWGMSIDLNKCTGCHACVVACQAENNIPIVGEEEVRNGREMHWLRIDRYFGGDDPDNPKVVTQPVACHHCEKAPCETVCPVAATVHSREGLNDMVYNRCIGTRYCGNNCPYKVRRFNYLNYSEAITFVKYPWADKLSKANQELRGLMMNPEVTVRSRGVMEKCTYCVQRIQNTKIKARNENNRAIRPNEITTACQDACPSDAIQFGDLSNKKSNVHAAHANPRSYAMLEELNILPRTKYLARVRNPHPALAPPAEESDDHGGHA